MLRSRWRFCVWVVDCGGFVVEGDLDEGVLGDVVLVAAED